MKSGGRLRSVGLGKRWKKSLDDLCRKVTFERDRYCCVKCGSSERIQWSHVRSRRYLSTRWSMFNVKTLCAGCHLWFGQNPIAAAQWFWEKFPDRHNRVLLASHHQHGKIDREAIRLGLEQDLARYQRGTE
jgi:5-methylcytosine-specific restriction endonuclease McrA